jgi:hypothetical protein
VVDRIITQAKADIKSVTGTTTGAVEDRAIRELACAYTVRNAQSKTDPNTQNGAVYDLMLTRFMRGTDDALRLKGKTIDGIKIQFTKTSD